MLFADKFADIEILVPYPLIPPSIDISFGNLSDIIEFPGRIFKLGCILSHYNADEHSLNTSYLTENVKQQLQFDKMDLIDQREEISETIASQIRNVGQQRGVRLIAFVDVPVINGGKGVAWSVCSIFAG